MHVMEPPPRIRPQSLADYLEVLTKIVFQAGLSWRAVEAKWPGFQQAFDGFKPESVASMTPHDVDRLAQDTRIIREVFPVRRGRVRRILLPVRSGVALI